MSPTRDTKPRRALRETNIVGLELGLKEGFDGVN
jgi:hypothetical protein